MSINKHIIYKSDRCSLLQRALKYIKENLAFRNQWLHLQRRGKTPNFLYLTNGARVRTFCENEFPIESSDVEESLESESVPNLSTLFEPSPIIAEKYTGEEHQAGKGAGHVADNCIDDPGRVPQEQIETLLPLPAESISNLIGNVVKSLDSCSGEIKEVATSVPGPEDESTHQNGLKDIPKRSPKNRDVRIHGLDCRDQMPLPFE